MSARSKTPPLNIALKDALCGVDGTVACTAGPNAALWGVTGSGTCDAGELPIPFAGPAEARKDHGDAWMSWPVSLTAFCNGLKRTMTSVGSRLVTFLASLTLITRSVYAYTSIS